MLELYVLNSIGHLEAKDRVLLEKMAPKLAQTYNIEGPWEQILQKLMDFPDNMPSLINDTWCKNQEIAKQHDATLQAEQFAAMFVDQNLT